MAPQQSTRATVAVIVVLSLVVAGAAPASSTNMAISSQQVDGLVVGSSHTSAQDFQNAQTLKNTSVSGSGDSADVTLTGSRFFDSFEGEPADTGVPDAWTEVAAGTHNVTTAWASDGSQSMHTDGQLQPSSQPYSATADPVSLTLYKPAAGAFTGIQLVESGTNVATVAIRSGDLQYFNGSNWQTITTAVDVGEQVRLNIKDIDASADTYTVEWTTPTNSGTATGLSAQADITTGYTTTKIRGGDGVFVDAFQVGQQSARGVYVSSNHSVSNAETATLNLTLANATATVTISEYTGGVWQTVNLTTYTTSANHTLDITSSSASTLRTNVTFEKTNSDYSASLHDESILFNNHNTEASNIKPANNTEASSEQVTFAVDVNDTEFSTAQGDNVTASLVLDGQTVYSETVSQNTTVSSSQSLTQGGETQFYWMLGDEYGANTTTEARTLLVPNKVYLYSERPPHKFLNGTSASVEITITGDSGAVKKVNVTDGTVDMTGLPSSQSYVFTVDAEGYYAREIYIRSIYDQAAVFLLNKSATTVQNSLTVTDRTGEYQEPIIRVDRVINTSRVADLTDNGDEWVTIGGDRLGASGFYIVNLQSTTRYRFTVLNDDGDTRVLGEYTAKADGEVPLEIGTIKYELGENTETYQWNTTTTNGSGSPAVSFAYSDPANLTRNLSVTFEYRNNSKEIASEDFTVGPYGEIAFTQPVNVTEYQDREFVVKWTAERNGSIIRGERIVGGKRDIRPPLSDMWLEVGYAGTVLVLAFVAGAGVGAPVAAVTVSIFSGLAVFLNLAPPTLGFSATILALFLAVAMIVFSSRQEF